MVSISSTKRGRIRFTKMEFWGQSKNSLVVSTLTPIIQVFKAFFGGIFKTQRFLLNSSRHRFQAGEGAVFSLPDGKIIPQGPDTRSRGNVFAITSGNRKNGLNITPETSIPQWHGEQMHDGVAVDMLLQCDHPG